MGTLEVSFYGPFLYLLKKDPIEIYAPICPGHQAGIFSAQSAWAMPGRCRLGMSYTYTLRSAGIKPGPATIGGNPKHFWDAAKAGGKLTTNQDLPFFCLTVPRPSAIHALNSDDAEIVNPVKGPQYNLDTYATGVRFYYDWDGKSNVTLTPPWPVGSPWVFDFNLPPNYDRADIQMRYATPDGDDPDHLEAKDCFSRAAALLSLSHWLSYDKNNGGRHLRAGNDCLAPILALQ